MRTQKQSREPNQIYSLELSTGFKLGAAQTMQDSATMQV